MSEIIKYTPVYYTEVNGWDSAEMRASETGDYIKVSDLDRDALSAAIGALQFFSIDGSRDSDIAHLTRLRDIAEGK